jgi:hypothetical protein
MVLVSITGKVSSVNFAKGTINVITSKLTSSVTFKFQDFEYRLLDIPRPKDAFLMFQISHCDKNKESGFYVVELKDKKQIKIGRTQDCDIKLHDISVSRHHATIVIEDVTFFIEDNCSKFGTLVLAN